MRKLFGLIVALVSVAYPPIIFFGTQKLAPAFFSLMLLAIAILKFSSSAHKSNITTIATLVLGLAFSGALAWTNSEFLLRLYPVAMSWVLAALFASSLRDEESLIEQFARLSGKHISENAKRYTRKLSAIWAVALLINGAIALYLAIFASLATWALYCGLLSYVIFALLIAGELVYRRYYIRIYGA